MWVMVWILGSPSCNWASNVNLDLLFGGWWAWLLKFNWGLVGSWLDLKAGLLLSTPMKVSSPSVEEIVAVLLVILKLFC
jgi:hypothetical protein